MEIPKFTKETIAAMRFMPVAVGGTIAGAALGAGLDSDDRIQGAKIGAVVGAGAAIGTRAAFRGSAAMKKIGPVGRYGALIAGTGLLALGGHVVASQNRYETVDVAQNDYEESYNHVQQRMERLNAKGDIVLGLHKRR